jgi:predicted CXXCH cytochrome family protein
MAPRRASFAMLMLVLVGLTSLAYAAEEQNAGNGGLLPVIPMGQGDSCVEDTDFMRRNHMDLLQHQRDETMKEGIRGKPYSLKECLSCHAVNGPDTIPVTVSSPQHFCRSCHDYAAVSIDCFQCHASRPEVQ